VDTNTFNTIIQAVALLGVAVAPTIASLWGAFKNAKILSDQTHELKTDLVLTQSKIGRKLDDIKDVVNPVMSKMMSSDQKATEAVEALTEKMDVIEVRRDNKLDEIHNLVNSQLEEAVTKLETAMKEIDSLQLTLKEVQSGKMKR
jgi:hypothetical protein